MALCGQTLLRIGSAAVVATATLASLANEPSFASTRPTVPRPAHTALGDPRFVTVHQPTAIADPPANVVPTNAFFTDCYPNPSAKCDATALANFDVARAQEGLGPMTLPTGFDSLTVAEQLFVVANIDRVDHGLLPVEALSAPLNSLALTGAQTDSDPDFPHPFDGNIGGSNWAGAGSSALLPEFLWVYDDGVGSGNEDCQKAGDPGCWGHRHNVLGAYGAPLLMGAAEVTSATYGGSAAEEFISEDSTDSPLAPQWSSFQTEFPVGLSRTAISLPSGGAQTVPVTVWASGVDMSVTAAVTSGAGAWSVSPPSCDLPAGSECTLTVGWNPQAGSPLTGMVTVTGPNGAQNISLSAPGTSTPQAALTSAAGHRTVIGGASTVITGTLTDAATHAPLAGHQVTVSSESAGAKSWTTIGSAQTTTAGTVSVTVRPTLTTAYRLVAASAGGYPGTTSKVVTVRVQPRLTLSAAHRRVAAKRGDTLTVISHPALGAQRVVLQLRVHGRWATLQGARLSAKGRHSFVVHIAKVGLARFRVIEPPTIRHLLAHSRSLAITIE